MKKLWIAMVSVIISLSLYLPVQAATVYSDGYFYYHAYEGYNSICGYFGRETTVVVPSSIAGHPVSRIEAGAFDGCSTIEKLVLPDTIMEIEEGAFAGAKNLKEIEDASGVWKSQGTGGNNGGEGGQENPSMPSGSENSGNPGNTVNPGDTGNAAGADSYEYEDTGDGQGTDGQNPAIGSNAGQEAHEPESSNNAGQDGQGSNDKSTSEKENAGQENDRQSKHGISVVLWVVIAGAAVILLAVAGILIWRRRRG